MTQPWRLQCSWRVRIRRWKLGGLSAKGGSAFARARVATLWRMGQSGSRKANSYDADVVWKAVRGAGGAGGPVGRAGGGAGAGPGETGSVEAGRQGYDDLPVRDVPPAPPGPRVADAGLRQGAGGLRRAGDGDQGHRRSGEARRALAAARLHARAAAAGRAGAGEQ